MRRPAGDWIAIILASGIALSVIILVIGTVIGGVRNGNSAATLSENEAQVITAAIGGMVGVLGAWVGYRAAGRHDTDDEPWPDRGHGRIPPRKP